MSTRNTFSLMAREMRSIGIAPVNKTTFVHAVYRLYYNCGYFIYLFIHSFVYLFIDLSIYLSIYLSLRLIRKKPTWHSIIYTTGITGGYTGAISTVALR